MKKHTYKIDVEWTGNNGQGTKTYTSYRRDHRIICDSKPEILGSSDASFRGDRSRYNPEELLVASLSACHMLWYLHLCSANHITVLEYRDAASGVMQEHDDGTGEFVEVTLRPLVKVEAGDDRDKVLTLHHEAHRYCFIANSVKFPVNVVARIQQVDAGPV